VESELIHSLILFTQNSGAAEDNEGEETDLVTVAVLRKNRATDGGFQTVVLLRFSLCFPVFSSSHCFCSPTSMFLLRSLTMVEPLSMTVADWGAEGGWWFFFLCFPYPFFCPPSCSFSFSLFCFGFSSVSAGGGAAVNSGSRQFSWRQWGRQTTEVLLCSTLFSLFSHLCISKQFLSVFQSSLSSLVLF